MKFNMINWALESVGTLLIMILPTSTCFILYMLLTSCGTPLVYFSGIGENIENARGMVRDRLTVVRRNKDNSISE